MSDLMGVLVTGRRGGKTHATMAWLAEDPGNRVVAVLSDAEAGRLLRHARLHYPDAAITRANFVGMDRPRPGTELRGRRRQVAVDNADVLLRCLFGDVELVTLSGDLRDPVVFTEEHEARLRAAGTPVWRPFVR